MIHVRPAEKSDVPWLLEQLREFSRFYGTQRPLVPSDPDMATRLVETMTGACPFFIAEKHSQSDGEADYNFHFVESVGFIAGQLGVHPYNPEIRVLTEMFWWVVPEYRGTRAGAILFNVFTAYGKQHADWVIMTLEKDSPVDPKSLEKRGYRLQESSYLLEVA